MVKPPPFPDDRSRPYPPLRLADAPQTRLEPAPPKAGLDPVLAGFDRIVALGCYVLLFVSPFTFGLPALAALALALFHRTDSQRLVRSHYRFQIRIFLTALLFAVLAAGSTLVGGGLLLGQLVGFIEANAHQVADAIGATSGARQALLAGGLVAAALLFLGLLVLWTLAASLFGFLRLIANRPIGHGVDHD